MLHSILPYKKQMECEMFVIGVLMDVQDGIGHDWAISQLRVLLVAVCRNESRWDRQSGFDSSELTDACLNAIAQEIRTREFGSCDTLDLEKLILTVRKPYWQSWEMQPSGVAKQILLRVRFPPALSDYAYLNSFRLLSSANSLILTSGKALQPDLIET